MKARRPASNVNGGVIMRVNVPLSEETFEAVSILAARNRRTVAQQIRCIIERHAEPFSKDVLTNDLLQVASARVTKRKQPVLP